MATNVDIGCESGGGVGLQSFFEAVKKVGVTPSLPSDYRLTINFDENQTYMALAFKIETSYYGGICYINYTSPSDYELNLCAGSYVFSTTGVPPRYNDYYLILEASNTDINLDQEPIEFYYLTANTYDQLMSQLGGA